MDEEFLREHGFGAAGMTRDNSLWIVCKCGEDFRQKTVSAVKFREHLSEQAAALAHFMRPLSVK